MVRASIRSARSKRRRARRSGCHLRALPAACGEGLREPAFLRSSGHHLDVDPVRVKWGVNHRVGLGCSLFGRAAANGRTTICWHCRSASRQRYRLRPSMTTCRRFEGGRWLLEMHGELFFAAVAKNKSDGRGRPGHEYWLNKGGEFARPACKFRPLRKREREKATYFIAASRNTSRPPT